MSIRPELAILKPAIAGAVVCALLAACNSKQDAANAAPDAPVLSVPIQRNGGWVVEAQDAGNKTHRVLLDTGASFNLFEADGPLAAAPLTTTAGSALLRQGVLTSSTADASLTINTLSGAHRIELGLSPALRVQGWSMPAGALAFRGKIGRMASADDQPFDGIIGMENMRNLTWRADHVAGRLTAYANAAPAHAWQQCTFMTLDTRTRLPLIEFGFDGESNPFILDTGLDSDLLLPQALFDNLRNAKKFPRVQTVFTTDITNRVVPRPEGLLAGLTIGQKAMPKLAVRGGSPDLRVGMGLLEKMDRFELDFRGYRFCFDLPAAPKDSVLTKANSVLERRGDRYEILALLPGGRLAESGVKVGDQITMIDEIFVNTLNLAQMSALLSNPATSELTLRRGNSPWVVKLTKPKHP
ncbi:hypothetical protein [Paraburkholderia tagetis]|uniref:Aspartyl protease n=1 Tax=Paraburkholderia tagetis TaxID=2913261 RepID=A0A9X1RPI8_9BURK|nr:hypothetical protein [Paraburkholderia tagetis]MCG5074345.1 hypothetical protein [Paraburkholderia tagetis]